MCRTCPPHKKKKVKQKEKEQEVSMPRIRIICTFGPASAGTTIIRNMILGGMDVVRLNFSHGSWDEHLQRLNIVRFLNKKYRRHIRILQDLEGNRIRIGKLKDGLPIELRKRDTVYLTQKKISGGEGVWYSALNSLKRHF